MTREWTVEQQLKRTEKEVDDLRRALDQSSIVAITDARGTITYVNQLFCEISQYSREELLGKNHRIINSGYHPKEFFSELWRTISSGKVWKGEVKNKAKNGSYYWVFTTIIPFLSAQGTPIQYVAIRTDITELKLAQEQAEQQRAALAHAEKMASVGELAAGIAHELGNPLAAISGRVEFLEMEIQAGRGNPEAVSKTLETVKRLADRMAAIIRGMRSLSRNGSNDPFQAVSLARLIQDILAFAWDHFEKNGIKIHIEEIPASILVCCQETQLSQVLVNLINNAKDAILDLEERWIHIEVLDGDDQVEIAITDSGKGIPEEISEKIMQPFFTTKPMGKGSGLGLSVSKSIIENHGGRLRIDFECENTRFIISLPKKKT